MYELSRINGLIKRGGLAAFAIAMLISLAAISTAAQAQAAARYECPFCEKALSTTATSADFPELRSLNAFGGFRGGVSVGVAAGQTVRILIETADVSTASLSKPSGEPDVIVGSVGSQAHVKVFDGRTGACLQIADLTSLVLGLNSIDINRDELAVVGEPGTNRIQLWIQLVIDPRPVGGGRAEAARVSLFPTFEVIDPSGATTVRGEINQAGLITFTGVE